MNQPAWPQPAGDRPASWAWGMTAVAAGVLLSLPGLGWWRRRRHGQAD